MRTIEIIRRRSAADYFRRAFNHKRKKNQINPIKFLTKNQKYQKLTRQKKHKVQNYNLNIWTVTLNLNNFFE